MLSRLETNQAYFYAGSISKTVGLSRRRIPSLFVAFDGDKINRNHEKGVSSHLKAQPGWAAVFEPAGLGTSF